MSKCNPGDHNVDFIRHYYIKGESRTYHFSIANATGGKEFFPGLTYPPVIIFIHSSGESNNGVMMVFKSHLSDKSKRAKAIDRYVREHPGSDINLVTDIFTLINSLIKHPYNYRKALKQIKKGDSNNGK